MWWGARTGLFRFEKSEILRPAQDDRLKILILNMLPKTLVMVESDPRTSPRAAEGIRIAAGIGAWRKTEVTLLLRGPAGYSLQEYADDLVDEDNFVRYLPIVAEAPRPIYLEDSFGDVAALEGSAFRYEMISPARTAELIRTHDYLIRL